MNTTTHSTNRLVYMLCAAIMSLVLLTIFAFRVNANSISTVYSNDFEENTDTWASSGTVSRVASGTNGITSASGAFHGSILPGANGYSGPSTQLGGYNNEWPGDWQAGIDVYLDPSWQTNTGFIYSVASNNSSGTYLRDYVFHAGVINDASTGYTNKLLTHAVTQGGPPSDAAFQLKLTSNNWPSKVTEINTAGWYSVLHKFRNTDGRLVVDVSIAKKGGSIISTWTLDPYKEDPSNPLYLDTISDEVGGNRYGWFTHVTMPGGLAIDNISRSLSTNRYNITSENSQPVNVSLAQNETITFTGVSSGTITNPSDLTLTGKDNNIGIFIPAGTKITAGSSSWDGTLDSPTVTSIDPSKLVNKKAHLLVKVGTDTPLAFSKPVKLVLPGQAGRSAGYLDHEKGAFHAINTKCAGNPTTLNGDTNECYINEGNDLVIWTNHFSVYLAYSSTNNETILAETGIDSSKLIALGTGLIIGAVSIIAIASRKNHLKNIN